MADNNIWDIKVIEGNNLFRIAIVKNDSYLGESEQLKFSRIAPLSKTYEPDSISSRDKAKREMEYTVKFLKLIVENDATIELALQIAKKDEKINALSEDLAKQESLVSELSRKVDVIQAEIEPALKRMGSVFEDIHDATGIPNARSTASDEPYDDLPF